MSDLVAPSDVGIEGAATITATDVNTYVAPPAIGTVQEQSFAPASGEQTAVSVVTG